MESLWTSLLIIYRWERIITMILTLVTARLACAYLSLTHPSAFDRALSANGFPYSVVMIYIERYISIHIDSLKGSDLKSGLIQKKDFHSLNSSWCSATISSGISVLCGRKVSNGKYSNENRFLHPEYMHTEDIV
jgi:hypothetical protein